MFWVTTLDSFFFIRFVYSTYVVGSEVRLREVKTEPSSVFFGSPFGSVQNGSNTGLVSIAITLKPAAAGVRNSDAWLVVVFFIRITFCTTAEDLSWLTAQEHEVQKKNHEVHPFLCYRMGIHKIWQIILNSLYKQSVETQWAEIE